MPSHKAIDQTFRHHINLRAPYHVAPDSSLNEQGNYYDKPP